MPSLEFELGGTAKVMDINRAGVIGRDPALPYVIDHPTMSRRHAEFHLNDDRVVLVDLGSANGTRVNEEALTGPRALRDGDWVEFGRMMGRFRDQAATLEVSPTAPATATAPDDALLSRLIDRDALLDELLGLTRESSLKAALGKGLQSLRNRLPQLSFVAVFDRINGDMHAAQPDASARPVALLLGASAGIVGEGRAIHFDPSARSTLARDHALPLTPQLMLAVELGVVLGKPMALYVDAAQSLDEVAELSLALASRALRAIVRHFDQARITSISEEDLKLAQRIQRRLIKSQPPPVPGYKVALSYTPTLAVGGDFYDLQITPSGELAIIIGDVSGKGVSASLYMATIMAGLRQFIPPSKGPADLLVTMNNWLLEVMEPGTFATMAACYLDPRKNSCRLAQAGHAPPVLRSANRKVIEMSSEPGAPLGAMSDMKPKEQRLALSAGDLLLFTTDGVEEGENALGEAYGNDRRDAALKSAQGAFAVTLSIRETLLRFVGSTTSTDDMTIIAVERED
jgi:serine phosphatase RsbU (regulator of sigma subunit)